jgi:hypothetical protein
MFGLFKRKPPADPMVTDRLKLWVGALMDLSDTDTIMLAELDCKDPGCLDLETVITVVRAVAALTILPPCKADTISFRSS